MRLAPVVLLIGLCACLSEGRSAGETLYVATGSNGVPGVLYTVDPTTAASTPVGPVLVAGLPVGMTGLDFNPLTGVLYGATGGNSPNFPSSLIILNPLTAVGTLVGAMGVTVGDIAFDSHGNLYGWEANKGSNQSLCSVNLATGVCTSIGPPGPAPTGAGLAFSPGGTLYVDNTATFLRTVNPATGVTTNGPLITGDPAGTGNMNAMKFNAAGTLFGSNSNRSNPSSTWLVTINTTAGTVTTIGTLPDNTDALAFTRAPIDSFLISYANLKLGDSFINVTNTGTYSNVNANGVGVSGGNICANVYVFDPNEEELDCCSCQITPNALESMSVASLLSANLTPEKPTSVVVKLLASQPVSGTCDPTSAGSPANPLAASLRAWMTTTHQTGTTPSITYGTEMEFSQAGLSAGEQNRLTTICTFITANGSGYGLCGGCNPGGR